MAIQLSETLSNGCSGNYWRIISINVDRANSKIGLNVGLYLSQAARQANNAPMSCSSYQISGSDYATAMAASNLVQACYQWLDAQPDFSGGSQC